MATIQTALLIILLRRILGALRSRSTHPNECTHQFRTFGIRAHQADYPYPDDDIAVIPSGGNPGAGAGGDAPLAGLDPSIPSLMSTARPEKLLRNDGSIVTEIVRSVSVSELGMPRTNRASDTGTKIFPFKSFLSANATRATNCRDRIDYCSSNNSTTCAGQSISVPIMIAAMGGYHFIRDDELILEKSDYVVVEHCTALRPAPLANQPMDSTPTQ